MLEFFWETDYKFGQFLKKTFGEDVYKRKYSLEGNGIYNLLYIDDKIYEIKYSQCKSQISNDNHKISKDKEFIIKKITEGLKCDKDKITVSKGKIITFPVQDWTAKVEVILKRSEPK